MKRVVLFLCTGNYYRSRFAEELFNARALPRRLAWRADSAGLAPRCFTRNQGPISRHTLAALAARHIVLPDVPRAPRDVTLRELEQCDRVIALCEREHRPLVEARGPLTRAVEYWHVEDLPRTEPVQGLAAIERAVEALLEELAPREGMAPDPGQT